MNAAPALTRTNGRIVSALSRTLRPGRLRVPEEPRTVGCLGGFTRGTLGADLGGDHTRVDSRGCSEAAQPGEVSVGGGYHPGPMSTPLSEPHVGGMAPV